MKDIFNDNFLKLKEKDIIDEIENTGYFFLENAIRKDHLDQIILDLSDKNFGLNNNFITPVWAKTQYYFMFVVVCRMFDHPDHLGGQVFFFF